MLCFDFVLSRKDNKEKAGSRLLGGTRKGAVWAVLADAREDGSRNVGLGGVERGAEAAAAPD
jgi:hypothetical protein